MPISPRSDGPAQGRTCPTPTPAAVLAEGQRLKLRSPSLAGSINLTGARIDDLVLVQHRRTLDEDSPPVRLLSPAGTENAYFLQIGWSGEGVELPDANTAWTASAPVLAPDSPVTLSWANGTGQRFEIGLAIDDDYMFTITQRVVNRGEGAVAVRPWTLATREGVSKNHDKGRAHV